MRVLVDLSDSQIIELAAQCQTENVSRAELIRRAIAQYLAAKPVAKVDAFGLWRDHPVAADGVVDGLVWQEQARAEW
jgi:hypothetical protein